MKPILENKQVEYFKIKKDVDWFNELCDFYITGGIGGIPSKMKEVFVQAKENMAKAWKEKQKELFR